MLQRLTRYYKAFALIFLNTILFIVVLEFIAFGIIQIAFPVSPEEQATLDQIRNRVARPYYNSQDWAQDYWEQHEVRDSKYSPYVIWAATPQTSSTINIDHNNRRVVPDTDCEDENAFRIFTFGGSAMWGAGSPDQFTIPAFLTRNLPQGLGQPICVINFGQAAWISTQSLIQLVLELKHNHIPDAVIFYDGANETRAASQLFPVDGHLQLDSIAARFEEEIVVSHLNEWLQSTNLYQLIEYLVSPEAIADAQVTDESIVDVALTTYLSNYEMVARLAETFDFQFFFNFQPTLMTTQKPLAAREQRVLNRLEENPDFVTGHFQLVQQEIVSLPPEFPFLYDLTHVLDDFDETIFNDWVHITPIGNEAVARAMTEILIPFLVEE